MEKCKNADTPEGKSLIREKDVLKHMADLLLREGLISLDDKLRLLSIFKDIAK